MSPEPHDAVPSPPTKRPAPVPGRVLHALARTFQSLGTRNFRLFFIGQTISNTGNFITSVALILFVLRLTRSGFAAGALAGCQFGPMLLLSPWAGVVADRGDKRKLLLLTAVRPASDVSQ